MTVEVLRYSSFWEDGLGGNPAGVVLGAESLSDIEMLAIAQAIGYSETAFLSHVVGAAANHFRVRLFSPRAEVDFCGHATVASANAIAERNGTGVLTLETNVGTVPVVTQRRGDDRHAHVTADVDATCRRGLR